MDSKQITKWAVEVGMVTVMEHGYTRFASPSQLHAFATLVANHKLEEAARLCDGMQSVPASEPRHCAEDIRSLKT